MGRAKLAELVKGKRAKDRQRPEAAALGDECSYMFLFFNPQISGQLLRQRGTDYKKCCKQSGMAKEMHAVCPQ